ncbi:MULTISPECIES: helix-turn-helix domain-containing protein [Priestia]|uniref:Helix-turn-helix domain protein n=2 Tax=Priestia TaxID=2800373 RepID=D5E3D0_PRIM1|nr:MULTISPECIES: helix-turn-helix transcriptional regulator [Priestia]KOP69806.1 XRE family transcriptional regulator [Bacillus sp. FJAT-21351]KQU15254.1 XRE family transcriptional regulator [Bacillus sp. Leaf75]MBZ5483157.1 helix-turn-helix transcriptional regulator [Bacillus sp. T_4]ADE72305.1 helix-turn-helix domain protein [Priestia megaterium QM B1551]MBA9043228.1 transcriptional regulator with XRE-family HTH domain [Priestia aryabhattai]
MWWKNPKRSKFGRFLDREGITQNEFAEKSQLSKRTISTLCNDRKYEPSPKTLKKIMSVINKMDKSKQPNDFFDI